MAPPKDRKPLKKPRVQDSSDGSGDEGGNVKPDVQPQYLNQPIDPVTGAAKMKTIHTEMRTLATDLAKSLDVLSEAAQDVAETLAKHDEDLEDGVIPPDLPEIAKLDSEYRLVLDKIKEVNVRAEILYDLRQKLNQHQEITNILGAYKEASQVELDKYATQTSRQKYLDDKRYKGFREAIWESLHGQPIPNLKKMIPAEAGDDEDSDDEIEVGPQKQDFKCPLLLSIMKDPMTSSACDHHYSKAGILDYLKDQAEKECPVTGCHAKISLETVKEDHNLKMRIDAHLRAEGGGGGARRGGTQVHQQIIESDDDD
ncbi:hypothetical protein RQP46_003111 [Phenoliferia psychrophenolica]